MKNNNTKLFFKKNYNLIINSEPKSYITKKFFYKKFEKSYNSLAYTFLITHKRLQNNIAIQIFTKHGPLAFLPLSNRQTSIVFSCKNPHNNSRNSRKISRTHSCNNSRNNSRIKAKVEFQNPRSWNRQ